MDNQLRQIIEEAWKRPGGITGVPCAGGGPRRYRRTGQGPPANGQNPSICPGANGRSMSGSRRRFCSIFRCRRCAPCGRRTRMARQNGPQARLRGAWAHGLYRIAGALREFFTFRRGEDPDALLRQYRSLGRCRHDGRYAGDGRFLRPGRRARPPERRWWAWAVCWNPCRRPRHHRGRLFHRLPGPSWSKGRTSAVIGAGRRRGDYRIGRILST